VDIAGWEREIAAIGEYLETFAPRLPERLRRECERVANALASTTPLSQREAATP
jgi:phosphoenolpyruvate carboxykinase (GTP)